MTEVSTHIKWTLQDLIPFVPHRPPMIWVDEVNSYGEDHGECEVHVKRDAHYMSPEGLRSSACLEFIAQTYGYCSVAEAKRVDPATPPLRRAFLVSFKDAEFADWSAFSGVQNGDILHVRFFGGRKLGPFRIFQGEVRKGDLTLCKAQIKAFWES